MSNYRYKTSNIVGYLPANRTHDTGKANGYSGIQEYNPTCILYEHNKLVNWFLLFNDETLLMSGSVQHIGGSTTHWWQRGLHKCRWRSVCGGVYACCMYMLELQALSSQLFYFLVSIRDTSRYLCMATFPLGTWTQNTSQIVNMSCYLCILPILLHTFACLIMYILLFMLSLLRRHYYSMTMENSGSSSTCTLLDLTNLFLIQF